MNNGFTNTSSTNHVLQSKNYFLLFVIWPFLAFVTALINYSQKEARRVVYLFLIYYGLTFVIGNVGNDAIRYALKLKDIANLPFSDFFKIVGGIYSSDTTVDIIEPLISFVISRFTSHHSILFASYAAIFGFFYLKSINLLHNRYRVNPGWNAFIHMAFFIVILPITAINGFRMWTAAWIFFYGAYFVILYHDPKYFILCISASFVHFSFLSANAVLAVYFLAGNRNIIYIPISILSFILPQLISPIFQSIFGNLGGGLRSRAEMYSSESTILGRQESYAELVWYVRIAQDVVLYYLILAIIIIQIQHRHIRNGQEEKNLFSFLLLFLAFVNFGKLIPAFGVRFQIIYFMFAILYIFLYLVKLPGAKINMLTLVGLFPMILYTAISFRQASDSINVWILTPGLGIPLLVPGISIADFLFP